MTGTATASSRIWKWTAVLLLLAVIVQSTLIVHLLQSQGSNGPECPLQDDGHKIQKRATTGNLYCPPGCVRRRSRVRTTTTEQSTNYWESVGYYDFDGPRGPQGPSGARGAPGSPGASGWPGMRGAVGSPGAVGGRGAPGSPGGRGLAGEAGQPGSRGAMGAPGSPGGRGLAGQPGEPGNRGAVGGRGLSGGRGTSGAGGPPGGQGFRGPSGSYREYNPSSQHDSVWPSPRGDQIIIGGEETPEEIRKKHLTQVVNDLTLYNHPSCVSAFDHGQVRDKLKTDGKASFMIMVDLAKSIYCIVHS